MDSTEARKRLAALIRGGNVNPIRKQLDRSRNFTFYAGSGKHEGMTDLDWPHLRLYAEAILRTGSTFEAAGLRLADGLYLEWDKAKLAAAITDKLIESADPINGTLLRFTAEGWRQLMADR